MDAEVDFGEVAVRLRGRQVSLFLFAFRLSFSGKAVHRIFASGGQGAFFERHVHAFTVLGGVPLSHVRYDTTATPTLERGNLANIGHHRLLSGFTKILTGTVAYLRPGGHVVITVRPWREHAELIIPLHLIAHEDVLVFHRPPWMSPQA